MGVPGQFKKPPLQPGRLRDLNDALHSLHLQAGRPSLDTMSRLLGKRISRTRLHDAFTEPRLPPWDTVDALVEVLASRAPNLTPTGVLPEVHALWVLASTREGLLDSARNEVLDEVLATVALLMGVRPRTLPVDVPLRELGGDSVFGLSVVVDLEKSFGVEFEADEAVYLEGCTVQEIADLVQRAVERSDC